jgi:hypothetical protein
MAHYAFLNADNIVTEVIVGRDENDLPEGVVSWEAWYGEFRGQTCKRTSYNTYRHYELDENGEVVSVESRHANGGTPFRGQYAGIGDRYDAELDEFITPESETPDDN